MIKKKENTKNTILIVNYVKHVILKMINQKGNVHIMNGLPERICNYENGQLKIIHNYKLKSNTINIIIFVSISIFLFILYCKYI